jgi:hypothetical protein
MEFLVNSLAHFSLNSEIHYKLTRNWKCLHVPQVNLSLYKKGAYYERINVFNSLPNWISDLVQNKNIFLGKLKSLLMEQSFNTANDFLDYCGTL